MVFVTPNQLLSQLGAAFLNQIFTIFAGFLASVMQGGGRAAAAGGQQAVAAAQGLAASTCAPAPPQVPYPSMPAAWRWVNRISPTTWILYGLAGSQLCDLDNEIEVGPASRSAPPACQPALLRSLPAGMLGAAPLA